MTEEQAIELLKHHALVHDETDHPKAEQGFLGMLKHYTGNFNEDNFHEVMEIIRCLANRLQVDVVDRTIIGSIFGICFCSWNWVIKQDSLLRRSHAIDEESIEKLNAWIDCIYWTTTLLLNGEELEAAFVEYHQYKTRHHSAIPEKSLACELGQKNAS